MRKSLYCPKCANALHLDKEVSDPDDGDRQDSVLSCTKCYTTWIATYHSPSRSWSLNEIATDAQEKE